MINGTFGTTQYRFGIVPTENTYFTLREAQKLAANSLTIANPLTPGRVWFISTGPIEISTGDINDYLFWKTELGLKGFWVSTEQMQMGCGSYVSYPIFFGRDENLLEYHIDTGIIESRGNVNDQFKQFSLSGTDSMADYTCNGTTYDSFLISLVGVFTKYNEGEIYRYPNPFD